MAIDSENKRASAFAVDTIVLVLPLPDGSIGDEDRAHVAGLYSGMETGAAEPQFDYDDRLTHITVVDGEVTAASDEPYRGHMDWGDRP